MKIATLLVSLQLLCLFTKSAQSQECLNRVGDLNPSLRIDTTELTNNRGVFLNINESSRCGGTVVGWRFCYFVQPGVDAADYNTPVHIGAWQTITVDNSTVYELINSSFYPLPVSPPSSGQVRFVCQEWTLPESLRFTIEQGAVVGVYFPLEAKAAHVLANDSQGKVTYWFKEEVGKAYFIPSDSLYEMESFSLYAEAILGDADINSSTTTASESTSETPFTASGSEDVVPLWAIFIIAILVLFTFVLAALLCLLAVKYRRQKTRQFEVSPLYEETISAAELQDLQLTYKKSRSAQPSKDDKERRTKTLNSHGEEPAGEFSRDLKRSTRGAGPGLPKLPTLELDEQYNTATAEVDSQPDTPEGEPHPEEPVESDYPYVLHTFEVVGHKPLRWSTSLPNILHNTTTPPSLEVPSAQSAFSSQDEHVYSYAYDHVNLLGSPGMPFMVDPRGRTYSRDAASFYGLQLANVRIDNTATSKRTQTIKDLPTPDYVEIRDDWIMPVRNKPMPLPRKKKSSSATTVTSEK